MVYHDQTKTDIAVREIRKRILIGVYKEGARLTQNELVQDLGLGVTPVREAFMQLISEGLLVRKPYSGVVVANLSNDSIKEVYALRKVLEKYAVEQACAFLEQEEFEELDRLIQSMKKVHEQDDDRLYQILNEEFHMLIYSASRNARLVGLIKDQWRLFPRGVVGLFKERREIALNEHEHILNALRRKDYITAGALMVAHIEYGEKQLQTLGNSIIQDNEDNPSNDTNLKRD